MNPVILFRSGPNLHEEMLVAEKYFPVYEHRSEIPDGSLVIPRYSALPYYKELDVDVRAKNSLLINSPGEHSWIADFKYYGPLKSFTPETWHEYEMAGCDYEGPFVVKGLTNSRKFQWKTQMFAPDKRTALHIGSNLANDSLIGPQGLIYRKYVPLKTYEVGINDLPFTNEWRFFFYKNEMLAYNYYWLSAENPDLAQMDGAGMRFAQTIADIAKDFCTFFVVDIAEKAEGGWVMIEMNDGSMSGLSLIDPNILYKNLKDVLNAAAHDSRR